MIADVLTKRLCMNKLLRFRHMLEMRPSTCNAACRKEWWRKALLAIVISHNLLSYQYNFTLSQFFLYRVINLIWMIKLFLVLHSSILVRTVTNSTIILPIILTLKKRKHHFREDTTGNYVITRAYKTVETETDCQRLQSFKRKHKKQPYIL